MRGFLLPHVELLLVEPRGRATEVACVESGGHLV